MQKRENFGSQFTEDHLKDNYVITKPSTTEKKTVYYLLYCCFLHRIYPLDSSFFKKINMAKKSKWIREGTEYPPRQKKGDYKSVDVLVVAKREYEDQSDYKGEVITAWYDYEYKYWCSLYMREDEGLHVYYWRLMPSHPDLKL